MKKYIVHITLGLILVLFATSCKKDYQKKADAIQKIEACLADNNYKGARKAIGKIPGHYDETVLEYTNKINKAEINSLIAKNKTKKAKALFVKSCNNQEFFSDNIAQAMMLMDDEFILTQLSSYNVVDEYSGDAIKLNKEAIDVDPEGHYGYYDHETNVTYNKYASNYNSIVESVFYNAIMSNNVKMAEKCIMLYMPIAKEVSRSKKKGYSSGHYDIKYEEDYSVKKDAEETLASLLKVKSIETRFNGAQFVRGSAELSDNARNILDELAAYMKGNESIRIKVVGHTSTDGKKSTNMALSTERAENVVKYLVEKGVSSSRLQSEGVGSSQLKDPDNPKSEENCRTEFLLFQ